MASRDVDLVIRARDESTKAVEAITKALNELVSGIKETQHGVEQGDSALSKFGKSIAELDKAFRGADSAERFSQQIDRALASTAKMEVEAAATAQEVERLAGELTSAAEATQKYRTRVEQTAQALEEERAALKKAQAGHQEVNQQLRQAQEGRSKLETQERRLTAAIEAQEQRLSRQKARLAEVETQMANAEKPTKRMASSMEAASAAIAKTEAQLAGTKGQLAQTRTALEGAGAAQAQYAQALANSGAAIDKQKKDVEFLKQELSETSQAARGAAQAERDLSRSFTQASDSLARQQTGLARAEKALDELGTNANQAKAAISELAAAAQGPLTQAFRSQQAVVSRINNAYQSNRQSLAALSQLMGQVGVPTREMVDAYNQLNAVSRQIATEFKNQQGILRTLRGELQNTATDTAQLAAQQRLFSSAVANGAAALSRAQQSASLAGTASQRIITANAQAARSYSTVATTVKQATSATQQLVQANNAATQSYQRKANASRQAMSYVQRLRGEVLSMVSAYGGLYGVINLLGRVVTSYQQLEAAQSRLGALFQGDVVRQGQELDWVRRNADRLGIEFGTLADEYTKFSAATKKTVLEGERTREVFLRIAEAGVVNKLSMDDMAGIFRAVIQIASKGKVQLEELQGQLGDRLPGAVQILADGLGITVQELQDLTKNGEVSSAALVNFASELEKRYGPQLAASLTGSQVALGQLRNAAFQAMIVFANSGFMESFVELVKELTETLKSDDFLEFAENVGFAVSKVVDGLTFMADNFQLTAAAATAFLAGAIVPSIVRLGRRFLELAGFIQKAAPAAQIAASGVATAGVAAATAATRVGLLARAFQLLFSSTGVGLALTAVSVGLSLWASEADDATEAMVEHQRIVDVVKNAYDAAGGSVENWSKKIQETTKLDAATNLEKLTASLDEARKGYADPIPFAGLIQNPVFNQLEKLDKQFRDGQISVDAFKKELSTLFDQTDDEGLRELITDLNKGAEGTRKYEAAVKTAQLVFKALTGTVEEKEAALRELNGVLTESKSAFDSATSGATGFLDTLDELKGKIPELAAEMDKLKGLQEIDALGSAYAGQAGFNNITPEFLDYMRRAKDAVILKFDQDSQKAFKDAFDAASDTGKLLLQTAKQYQGFDENVPSQRNALSEFFKAANQNVDPKITAWCAAFVNSVLATNGLPDTGKLNARSFLDYGSNTSDPKPGDIVVLKRGKNSDEGHVGFFMGFTPTGGINVLGGNQDGSKAVNVNEFKAEDVLGFRRPPTAAEAEQERAKDRQATADRLAGLDEEIAQQSLINAGKEREAAIQKAISDAKKENKNITAEELAQVAELEGKKWDLANAEKLANEPKKAAQEAEEKVNDLLTRQQELRAQLAIYTANGDTAMMGETKTALEGINTELMAAIDNAIAMWEAIGGTEAAAKIETLRTAKLEAQQLAQSGKQTFLDWERVGELFVSGLTNAFDRFAQAVAEGKDIGEAARDAFLQFAADFLIEIGKMIIRQALFNLLRGLGGPFANLGVAGTGHSGGVVGSKRIGSGNSTRQIDMGVFATAPRFHGGAVLRPGEVPAILEEGEEVLDKNDPRNILNGGAAAGGGAPVTAGGTNLRIINAFDAADVVSQGLASTPGEETLFNFVRSNRGTINDILGK